MQSDTRRVWGNVLIVIGIGWLLLGLYFFLGIASEPSDTIPIGRSGWLWIGLLTNGLPGLAAAGAGTRCTSAGLWVAARNDNSKGARVGTR